MTIDELLEAWRVAATNAGTLAADVERFDEERRIVLSRELKKYRENMSVADSEHQARASDAYSAICNKLREVRIELGAARAEADYMEKRIEVWRTKSATARVSR